MGRHAGESEMKLRHAAALILTVAGCASTATSSGAWLLMVPPLSQNRTADIAEPLSKWRNVGSYSSQIDCTNSMANQQFAAHGNFGPIWMAQTPEQADAVKILNGQCVSSRDPHLKSD